jgi:tetratricopeptide (TPR) repeat protein
MGQLGAVYRRAGRPKEAVSLLEEARRGTKKDQDFDWVAVYLMDAYRQVGEDDKAADVLLERVPVVRNLLPKDSAQLGGFLASSGTTLLEMKKWAQAEPLLRESLAIREKTQPNDWSTFNSQSMLGGSLLGQKKYADAEPLLLTGYEGMKQREKSIPRSGGGELRIPQAIDRLIELYTTTNKPDEAKKWRAERAKYPENKPAQKK